MVWPKNQKQANKKLDKGMGRWRQRLEWYPQEPLNAKECWQPPEVRREAVNGFSLNTSRRNRPCQCFDFWPPASRTIRDYISVVWCHPAGGTLLWQHCQMNIRPLLFLPAYHTFPLWFFWGPSSLLLVHVVLLDLIQSVAPGVSNDPGLINQCIPSPDHNDWSVKTGQIFCWNLFQELLCWN